MAATTSHEHYPMQHLPPSPPPSPPQRRRKHKKRTDSFEKLANTPILSPPSSPSQGPVADADKEPLLVRIILTPVLFISFIVSLSLVNLRDRAHRTYEHSSASFLTYLYRSSWLELEPYQDPDDSKWGRGGSIGHVEPCDSISRTGEEQKEGKQKKKRSWHLNKKIRKVAKLEISDAFEMRGGVIVGMLAMIFFGSMVLWMGMKWLVLSTIRALSH
ncbi:hypothetical protein EK21DRAFT_97924 [Setomelanomma holmii]|uniref:Uncharacterized protein n=1 Tax=Setomelanomma holmii TaxID=210430 RepID=A0A9P4LRJ4_9PLEO|nr:hypothetical protein EK21DRAFT_97924 [Setomelanomma holmii]